MRRANNLYKSRVGWTKTGHCQTPPDYVSFRLFFMRTWCFALERHPGDPANNMVNPKSNLTMLLVSVVLVVDLALMLMWGCQPDSRRPQRLGQHVHYVTYGLL